MSLYLWLGLACALVWLLYLVAYLAIASEVAISRAKLETREIAALAAAADLIGDTLRAINRDLLFLARDPLLAAAVNKDSENSKQALGAAWQEFSRSRGMYDKIRWLDEYGLERVRVNYAAGNPQAVPAGYLQSRLLRYFFRDAFALNEHEIYVSPFDLNVEGEVIETPFKPTLRIATPLFNAAGERRGILLLNYLGADLFQRIVEVAADVAPNLWLTNAQGYWLRGASSADEWGFMFDRPDLSMASLYPAAWRKIAKERRGQFLAPEGLWTFETVYPVLEGQVSSSGSSQVFSPSRDKTSASKYFWKVITLTPRAIYDGLAQPMTQKHGLTHLGYCMQQFVLRLKEFSATHGRHHGNAQDNLAAQVFEHANEGIMITDVHSRLVRVNKTFSKITGYSAEEVIGKTPVMLRSGRHPPEFYRSLWDEIRTNGAWQGEIWNRRKNGEVYAEWLSISRLRDTNGVTTHYIGVFSDITQLKLSSERMEYFAHHDTLTGLPNRRLLMARLDHSIQFAKRDGRNFALIFIDLDDFKGVNDQLGHAAGDEVLKEVATRIKTVLRGEDTLARLGGDEFVVLLENTSDLAQVARVNQAIIDQFPCMAERANLRLEVTASLGISFYPQDGQTPVELLGSADHAMYRAKHRGGNQAVMARAQAESGEAA